MFFFLVLMLSCAQAPSGSTGPAANAASLVPFSCSVGSCFSSRLHNTGDLSSTWSLQCTGVSSGQQLPLAPPQAVLQHSASGETPPHEQLFCGVRWQISVKFWRGVFLDTPDLSHLLVSFLVHYLDCSHGDPHNNHFTLLLKIHPWLSIALMLNYKTYLQTTFNQAISLQTYMSPGIDESDVPNSGKTNMYLLPQTCHLCSLTPQT